MAGAVGLEPTNAGIKIPCLNQLGDTPEDGERNGEPKIKLVLRRVNRKPILDSPNVDANLQGNTCVFNVTPPDG